MLWEASESLSTIRIFLDMEGAGRRSKEASGALQGRQRNARRLAFERCRLDRWRAIHHHSTDVRLAEIRHQLVDDLAVAPVRDVVAIAVGNRDGRQRLRA